MYNLNYFTNDNITNKNDSHVIMVELYSLQKKKKSIDQQNKFIEQIIQYYICEK